MHWKLNWLANVRIIRNSRYFYDCLLFVVAVGLYSPSLMNGFVGDDYIYFIGNRPISSFDVRTILLHGAIGSDYCPLRDLSLALDYLVWGEYPFGFHLTNLLLYGITAVAVKYLFTRFSDLLAGPGEVRKETFFSEFQIFLAALLFAIHPIHREVVYAVYNRGALLTTLFSILSCLAFMRFLQGAGKGGRSYCAAFFWCICAFMSREYGIILPLILVLLVGFHEPSRRLSMFLRTGPFFIAAAIFYFVFRQYAIDASYIQPATVPFLSDAFSKLTVAFKIVMYYPARMSAFEISSSRYFGSVSNFITAAAVLIVAVGLFAGYSLRRRHPRFLFSLLFYLICLIPVLNFFNTEPVVSDRYVYLPSLGLFFLITAIPFQAWKRFIPVACLVLVSFWVMVTFRSMGYWNNDVAYWERYAPKYRYSYLYARLGGAYFKANNLAGAQKAFNMARFLSEGVKDDLLMADLCLKIGYYDGAIVAYKAALSKNIESPKKEEREDVLHSNLAVAYYRTRDFRSAIIHFERSMERNPANASVELYSDLAASYYNIGDFQNALHYYKQAITLNPRIASLHNNVGGLNAEMGNYREAVHSFELAAVLDPDYGSAFLNLARSYRDMGHVVKEREYAEVLRVRFPDLLKDLQNDAAR